MVKELLERLMQEERALCLAEHPTKAKAYVLVLSEAILALYAAGVAPEPSPDF
ncbi:MAG: hypothetical protein QXX41_00370 [Nitrososphaerota archaeon]